jgi:6-phosphogluconolactonase
MAHPHQIRPTPDGRHLLVCDVGLDIVFCYETTEDGAITSTPPLRVEFPPVSAPRHLEFDPSGRYVYVNGETDSMLYVLEADAGVPSKIIGSAPCAPPGFEGHNSPTELMLHPDGRTLYLASRGSNTVTIFDIDNSSGSVEVLGHADTLDGGPRGLKIDPSGRFVVVANTEPASIVVFRVGEDRLLEPVAPPLPCHAPSSLLFIEAS